MPLQATSGAASYDGFGGGVAVVPTYIEDVFSTYLYKGTGAAQTITNGIDLSTKGGLVWTKSRSAAGEHNLVCNDVGLGKWIKSNSTTIAQSFAPNGYAVPVFNTTGVTLSDSADQATNAVTYTSWSLRKQPKFFDVVTYTGNATARTIAHSLGSVPGCIIVKSTTSVSNWYVYHRSLATNQALKLNSTAAIETATTLWNNTAATSTEFSVGTAGDTNGNGQTFVAYLFAHDAGGFGLTGTDNVISCGSFTTDGSGNATVSLGYEPQWVLLKASSTSSNWEIDDTFRGMPVTGSIRDLIPNSSAAEGVGGALQPSATGFYTAGALGGSTTYIYIAIRRGPMKVPTLGTSVFSPNTATYSANQVVTTGFPVDMLMMKGRTITLGTLVYDRLRGLASTNTSPYDAALFTSDTSAETAGDYTNTANNTGYQISPGFSGFSSVNWNFGRAPGFFDEVCYTGTGGAATINHNLGVVPELIIFKNRSGASNWPVNVRSINTNNWVLNLEENSLQFTSTLFSSAPTSSTMTFTGASVNATSSLYVAYLFATCAGVSKVGSYTGNGTNQTIDCGFTAGARFVLIKRATSGGGATTGDWYVWDSARGIVAGNDPHLSLNTTAAEVTTDDSVDTDNSGFIVNQLSATNINFTSATYIFLAIA